MKRPASPARTLTTSSAAEPGPEGGTTAPDASLADPVVTHRGLTYPFGRNGPETGDLVNIAEGLSWARLPVPGSLNHINVWLVEDDDGIAIVDTGLKIPPAKEAWKQLLAGPLHGRKITRVICTHFHPDHIGLAGWLTHKFGVRLWMSRGEWLFARMLTTDVRDSPPPEALDYWRLAGWDEDRISVEAGKGWGRFSSVVSPVPVSFVRLSEGDKIRMGAREWRVVMGSGHSPEHACLLDEAGGLLIAGDQVLPRITSNVSLSLSEPEADPLGEWLESIVSLRRLPSDLLVLPSHGEPFTGLRARLDALAEGHRGRLEALHDHLGEPRRAVDCFGILFGRKIDDSVYGLATGEAMAHLRWLENSGKAVRRVRDGVAWFSRAPSA